jgi:Na+-transporting methylmalonyl-CoA/oxaloacetate decarboxylase gamma subunit
MNTTQVKILVSVFLVLAAWRVFEIPGVSTVFWTFITVGAIPGSDRVLGTETVLRILCVVFAVIFFLIFRKEFMASLPKRASHRSLARPQTVEPGAEAVSTTATTRDRIVVVLTRQQERRSLVSVRPAVVYLGRAAAWIVQLTCWVEADCRRVRRVIARRARWSAARLTRATRWMYRRLLAATRFIICVAILAWKMAEPHIRNFDRWLDKQLHTNKNTAETLDFMSGMAKAAADTYRRAQQASRNLRENK